MILAEYLVSMAFAVFTAAAFIVAGIVLIRNADMEINNTFGYRTPRSTKNQETWRFANIYSGKIFIIGGAIGAVILAIIACVKPDKAYIFGPLYALCEGLLVGAVSAM